MLSFIFENIQFFLHRTKGLSSHPLLHLQLEPWVPSCVLFGWWVSPWDLWGVWLVNIIVLPMGLQTLQLLQSFL